MARPRETQLDNAVPSVEQSAHDHLDLVRALLEWKRASRHSPIDRAR